MLVAGPDDVAAEALMMGLRLVEGVDRARFQALTGFEIADYPPDAEMGDDCYFMTRQL